jgi:aspartate aminotransferase
MSILSNRLNQLKESATLAMAKKSRELSEQGKEIINLSIGEPDFNTPGFIKQAAKEAIDNNFTHYTPVPGYNDLRDAICNKLKRDNKVDYLTNQIVVSNGAKQSISNVFMSILDPEDEVLVPAPYWVSYLDMIKLAEGKPVVLHSDISKDFKTTGKEIEKAVTEKTKAFIFSSPCNPSGSVYTKEELEDIANTLAKYPNIIIISDEIYEHINFNGKHESIAQFSKIRDQLVIVNGVSKGFAMTGWRIGFIAAPVEIAAACTKLQGQTTSGASSIAQKAAKAAFDANPNENREILDMVAAFRKRRDLLMNLLDQIEGFKLNTPPGAFYLFPDISSFFGKKTQQLTIKNANDLAMYLLEEAQVACVSGEAFGTPNCLRISYAASEEKLKLAAGKIKEACNLLK